MNDYTRVPQQNGLDVFVSERPGTPVMTLNLVFRAGCAYESADERGYAHILEHMLLKGTRRRPGSTAIGLEIDSIGAFSNAFTGYEELVFVMQSASESIPLMLDVLSDNVQNALLDAAVLENEKKVILEEFEKQKNNYSRTLIIQGIRHLLGDRLAAQEPLGDPESIMRATSTALADYQARTITPANATLFIIADMPKHAIGEQVQAAFLSWRGTTAPSLHDGGSIVGGNHRFAITSEVPYWMVADATEKKPTLSEYAGLKMLTNWLGYGYSSLLRDELRTKRGLVYTPSTYLNVHGSATVLGAYTSSRQPEEAIHITEEIFNSLEQRITDAEVTRLARQFRGITMRTAADPMQFLSLTRELLRIGQLEPSIAELLDAAERIDASALRSIVHAFLDPSRRLRIIAAK